MNIALITTDTQKALCAARTLSDGKLGRLSLVKESDSTLDFYANPQIFALNWLTDEYGARYFALNRDYGRHDMIFAGHLFDVMIRAEVFRYFGFIPASACLFIFKKASRDLHRFGFPGLIIIDNKAQEIFDLAHFTNSNDERFKADLGAMREYYPHAARKVLSDCGLHHSQIIEMDFQALDQEKIAEYLKQHKEYFL